MTVTNRKVHCGYDVFLSHNHAEKDWVRELAERLANTDYNGRPLRPWLDEQVINPGDLSSKDELTSALDRSRFLAIVLSKGAVESPWVDFELNYFSQQRGETGTLPLLKENCVVPTAMSDRVIDFTREDNFEDNLTELLNLLRPENENTTTEQVKDIISAAVVQTVEADPGGLWPDPTPERDELLASLLMFNIDDLAEEGLAVIAFTQAASLVSRLIVNQDPSAYNMKMLLGDCLAVGIHRSPAYRQIAQRVIDQEDDQAFDPAMYFSVARAFSKLAELDTSRIDVSVLLRLARGLDAGHLTGPRQAIAMMIGHVVGKIRDSKLGELLLKSLSEMGSASKMAVAIALSLTDTLDESVFYLSTLKQLAETNTDQNNTALKPPSRRLLSLFFDLQYQNPEISLTVENAKKDITRAYGIDDFPYPYSWDLLKGDTPAYTHNAPFTGNIVMATTDNMVQLADQVKISDVVILTQPRVVDALFDNAGALIVIEDELESIRSHRLRSRSIPFCTIGRETMEKLQDGDLILVNEDDVKIMKGHQLAGQ